MGTYGTPRHWTKYFTYIKSLRAGYYHYKHFSEKMLWLRKVIRLASCSAQLMRRAQAVLHSRDPALPFSVGQVAELLARSEAGMGAQAD